MQKTLKNMWRCWKILKPFQGYIIFLTLLSVITQGLNTIFTIILAKILTTLSERDITHVTLLLSILAGLYITEYLVDFLYDWLYTNKLDRTMQQHLQEFSLKKILNLTIDQHLEDHSSIKQTLISNGESAIENIVTTVSFTILQSISMFLFSVGTLFYYDYRLGCFGLFISTIIFTWMYRFAGYHQPFIEENQKSWRENNKTRTEVFSHLPLVKYQAQEEYFINKYIDQRLERVKYAVKVWNMAVWHRAKRDGFIKTSSFVSSVYTSILYLQGSIALGTVYLVWNINSRLYWQLTSLSNSLRKLPFYFDDVQKYFEILDKEPNFKEKGDKGIPSGDIIFSNVTFRYPKGSHPIYDSLSFVIPQGKITALVGSSGSGKSTITKLLLRAYDYSSGSITIGNKELKNLDTHTLRHNIGYVEQHVDLLDETIKENILFGTDKNIRKNSELRLEDVAKLARIDQFYHRLGEEKFDTVVGERGIKLSGGERQRIGIARAIIKDPEILIFDEATSSLDTENEKYVMDAINDVSKGKTTIIIAHRLSTVRHADKIIVMDKGRVVGEGTHDELMGSNEVYQNLVAHQV